jgi:cell division protease FtsH
MNKKLKSFSSLFIIGAFLYGGDFLIRQSFGQGANHWVFWLVWMLLVSAILLLPKFFRRESDPNNNAQDFLGGMNKIINQSIEPVSIPSTRLDDVAGIDEVKDQVMVVIDFLQNPIKYQALGAKLPKGILLSGDPGTGKTLLARAIAGETGLPFYSISGGGFIEVFAGVGAARVRELFDSAAKEERGAIIFIDEIDAIGGHRSSSSISNGEREQTLNQLLTEMDGFEPTKNILVIAATNRPDILDSALLRPGRFDRKIAINRPTRDGRLQILRVHSQNVPLSEDVNLLRWATITPGFTGADLQNLINESVVIAANELDHEDFMDYLQFKQKYESTPFYCQLASAVTRWGQKFKVSNKNIEQAFEIIVAGLPCRQALTEREQKIVAVHEAGHAVVQIIANNIDAVEKVSIIPTTSGALGYTLKIHDADVALWTLRDVTKELMVALAGRAAEEIVFNEYSSGAASDLLNAKNLSIKAIDQWGLGSQHINPDKTAVEKEAIALIDEAYKSAKRVIRHNRDKFDQLVTYLLEHDVALREDLRLIFS